MTRLQTSKFDYQLPRSFIAQEPLSKREDSRLLVYHGDSGLIEHSSFGDIGDYIDNSAMLVLNDTKVFPARLLGRKRVTGGKVEILLVRELGKGLWECLLKPSARLKRGVEVVFPGSPMVARMVERMGNGSHSVLFEGVDDFWGELERIGWVPLPPYIKRQSDTPASVVCKDKERYQTVYAKRRGAVAAPTAGLHFSNGLLGSLEARGMEMVYLTLHVGPGTFLPVKEDCVSDHRLHAEFFEITDEAAESINRARADKRPVVVVGTTVARVLETVAGSDGKLRAGKGWTDLFIYPPYRFKVVENMLTNFHLPCSTLLMLVAALVGSEKIIELYEIAKRENYRFYSYGDAMLIIGR